MNGLLVFLRHTSAILAAVTLLWTTAARPLEAQSRRHSRTLLRAAEAESEKELSRLARALREEQSAAAYARLGEFAAKNSTNEVGARAALALGYYDFTKGRHAQARAWLERAQRDTLLREYLLYWRVQVERAQGHNAEALAQLDTLRREFPESVMTEQAVESQAEAALVLGQADRAVAALDAYERTASKASLLLLRAQAREKASRDKKGVSVAAARDYLAIYYRFPLSDEAKPAGARIPALRRALGKDFPEISIEQQIGRATAFFEAKQWREARVEYEKLLHSLPGATAGSNRERAMLRIAQCRVQLGAAPALLAKLALSDADVDAERLYALSQFRRSEKKEAEMLAAIEQLAARYPQSRWTEEGLFAGGNYFWVELDRKRATLFYRRVLDQFPSGKNSQTAQWRLAWAAYLERQPEAAALLEEHLRRFPGSTYTVNALYWLGRAAERAENIPHARSFYLRAQERFPQSYFGRQSAERLRVLGAAPVNSADFLALISSPVALPSLDEPIPPAARERWARAEALRTIAFDASAELELRAAYLASGSPRVLLEAAQSAIDAGRYAIGMATARLVYPQLEARRIEEVPVAVWRAVYPLPFELSLRGAAARHQVDPMLVAGVIRQESTFEPDAVSRAGAVGLMQVLPKTGRKLARRLKLRYARAKLFNAEYNLQLGTLYLADLLKTQGSPEAALATFNAGEDRVAAWQAERRFKEPAEFVESIPFTETREYVQIVLKNTEVYRRVYEAPAR